MCRDRNLALIRAYCSSQKKRPVNIRKCKKTRKWGSLVGRLNRDEAVKISKRKGLVSQSRKFEQHPKTSHGRKLTKGKAVLTLASHPTSRSLTFLICRKGQLTQGVVVKIKADTATGTH